MKSIDLNADLGEGCGNDKEILKYVSSANIACGLHAGSPHIMRETVKLAIAYKVSIGAHPGYPDRDGFGRVPISMSFEELYSSILYQVGALKAITEAEGAKLSHVKAHGALYNSSSKDKMIASAIAKATRKVDPDLIIFGQSESEMEEEAKNEKMRFCSEFFADRGYMDDGSLVPRSEKGAIIADRFECSERVLEIIKTNSIKSLSGKTIQIKADTICLHGDNDKAIEFARHLHNTLTSNKVGIQPFNS